MTLRFLSYLLFFYLALAASLFFIQRSILYQPSNQQLTQQEAAQLNLAHWPAPEEFRAFLAPSPQPSPLGTVLVFHGNAGAAFHRSYISDALSPLGFQVFLIEYPGYGARPGQPSEEALVADSLESLARIHAENDGPIYLWGESLGAGVAAAVARQSTIPIDGLVLFFPWDTLPNLAQQSFWYLPARWLIRDRFDNVANLRDYAGRVAVILAEQDEIVPLELGQNLYASLSAEKELWIFEGASHNNFPHAPDLAWWSEVMDFLGE